MNVHIPTEMEIFRIAFITMRGWRLNYNKEWFKKGQVRPLTHDEEYQNKFAHSKEYLVDGTKFDLATAYYRETEGDDDE